MGLPHFSHPSHHAGAQDGASWLLGRPRSPCRADGLGVIAHPLGSGWLGWLPSLEPQLTLDSAPGTALGCWGDRLVYLPSGLR